MSTEKLKSFDTLYEGKLNPRCTFHCTTCDKFYSNKMERVPKDGSPSFTLIVDDENNQEDCVHYNDVEIREDMYEKHMEILKERGFLTENEEGELEEPPTSQ